MTDFTSRYDIVRAALHAALLAGPANARDVVAAISLVSYYVDISNVVNQEVALGNLIVKRKGDVYTWSLPGNISASMQPA